MLVIVSTSGRPYGQANMPYLEGGVVWDTTGVSILNRC